MNLKFKKIIIKNFLSIGETELNLEDNEYVLVKGINNNPDDLAKSNGSGKSSIFEAISWVLTGETIRGIKSNISNINAGDGAYVELTLDVNGEPWRIIRTKDNKRYKTTLKVFVGDSDKSGKGIRDTEKLLSEYLPDLTPSLIGSVIVLGQGLPQRFSNNSPSGRKEVLEKLSKSDFMIEDLKKRISDRRESLSADLRGVSDKLLELRTKRSMLVVNLESYKTQLSDLGALLAATDELDSLKCEESKLSGKIEDLSSQISHLTSKVQDYRQEYLKTAKIKSDTISNHSNNRSIELLKLEEEFNTSIGPINTKISDLKARDFALLKEIDRLGSIKDVCPTCGQKLQGVVKPDVTGLENEHSSICDMLKKLTDLVDSETKRAEALKNAIKDKYSNLIESDNSAFDAQLSSIVDNANKLKSTIADLEASRDSCNQRKITISNNIVQLDLTIKNYASKKNELEFMIESTEKDIADLDKNILYNNKYKEDLTCHLDVISKFNTMVSRDFRGYLLLSVIDYINKRAKDYSRLIFNTDKINFSLNGNNIDISYCDKQYENLSGGEKQKVDLIVQFSIRDMLCKFLNFSCNILVVDEIFDNLDSIGCQRVINLISTELSDISSIFVITHRGDLEIPYDHELIVEKNEKGISTLHGIL